MCHPVVGRKNFYGSGALWSGWLAAMLFSLSLALWGLCPRRWLTAFLTACAEAGQVPANWQTFLPWRMTQAHYDTWADQTGPPAQTTRPNSSPPDR